MLVAELHEGLVAQGCGDGACRWLLCFDSLRKHCARYLTMGEATPRFWTSTTPPPQLMLAGGPPPGGGGVLGWAMGCRGSGVLLRGGGEGPEGLVGWGGVQVGQCEGYMPPKPSVSRVDLTGLASSKQASSKHAQTGQKSQLCHGASDSAIILVEGTYGCEGQPHKV